MSGFEDFVMDFPPSHPFVTFTLTPEDYCGAMRLCARRYWLGSIRPRIGFAVMFGGLVMLMAAMNFDLAFVTAVIWLMIALVAMPFILYYRLLPRRARKIHAQQKSLQVPVGASWTEKGYFASSALGSGTIPWTSYHDWRRDKAMILLMQSEVLFQMIPRRALSAEQDADLVAALERSGLKEVKVRGG